MHLLLLAPAQKLVWVNVHSDWQRNRQDNPSECVASSCKTEPTVWLMQVSVPAQGLHLNHALLKSETRGIAQATYHDQGKASAVFLKASSLDTA